MAVFSPEFKRQQRFRDTHQTSATTNEQNENSVFFVVVRASNFVRWGLADFTDSNWVFFFFSLSLLCSSVKNLQKRFIKGLRQFGKNFFRIRKELLPNKETVRQCFLSILLNFFCVCVCMCVICFIAQKHIK